MVQRVARVLLPPVILAGLALAAWLTGLIWFAQTIPREEGWADRATDAIVVLTGGSDRSEPDPAPAPPVAPVAPGASVLHEGVVTLPDGSTVPVDVDNEDVLQMAVLTDGRIVLAVDVSPWLRSDAPTSSDRLFCHVHGRAKGNAQMIPGWPYSFVAALEPGRTSWTALLDAVRLGPEVLRSSTAGPAALAVLSAALGRWASGTR